MLNIYDLESLGFEVLEEFEEDNKDKEANKVISEDVYLSAYVQDNLFVVHAVKSIPIEGLKNPITYYSNPFNFSSVEEVKEWLDNVLPTLGIEFVN